MARMIGNLEKGPGATLPHPPWVIRRHFLTSVLVLIMLIGASALTISRGNRSERPVVPAVMSNLPVMSETLLVVDDDGSFGAEGGPGGASISAYLPGTNALNPVLDAVQRPIISPDGKRLLFTQITHNGAEMNGSIVALATNSLATQWTTNLAAVMAAPDRQSEPLSLNLVTAATSDRVYAVPLTSHAGDPLTVIGLDAFSGQQRSRWTIDLGGQPVVNARLVPAPDGRALYVLAVTGLGTNEAGSPLSPGPSYYVRIGLPDGGIEETKTLDAAGQSAVFWGSHLSGDGRSLYSLETTENGTNLVLRFFDLPSGTAQPPVALSPEPRAGYWATEEAVSHDGRVLYVFDPVLKEITLVDLFERSVVATHPLDTGAITTDDRSLLGRLFTHLRDALLTDASAKFSFSGNMQLSPDGSRLYAVGVDNGRGYDAMPRGIWAIDTTTWSVMDRWMSELQPSSIVLSEDGVSLFVQEGRFALDQGDRSGNLWLLDTRTGNPSIVSNRLISEVFSTAQLYRERYGLSPASAGVATGPSAPLLPSAALAAKVSTQVSLTGDQVQIEARFTDPRNGSQVKSRPDGYRFDPPDRVTATLAIGPSGNQSVSVPLRQAGYGVYRGVATLTRPGIWSLRVLAERASGPASHVFVRDAVSVQQAFAGSDGRRYLLKVMSGEHPVAKQATSVRLTIVDAQQGKPLPAGVTLKVALPATLEFGLFLANDAGVSTATLSMTSYGIYDGHWTPWTSGTWSVQVGFPTETGEIEYLTIGAISVGSP